MRAVVVIPTYNERENVRGLVERILHLPGEPVDLFFIDDNSPDGTGRMLDDLSAHEPRLKVLHRPGKMGLGSAYREAYRALLKQPYDCFIPMDADLSHCPEMIPTLLNASTDAHLVIGSRYCPGGGSKNWSLVRRTLSFTANHLCRVLLGLKSKDSTAGFRCYRRELLVALDQLNIRSNGYAFQVEMTYYSQWLGSQLREVPITFEERVQAKSKMCRSEITSAVTTMARLWVHRMLGGGAEARKVLAPLTSSF
jgi:glycosyltransferase involved in cell wall biosynthesis